MTTIAWDGRVLAGDRLSHVGGTPVRARKVYRVRDPDGRIALVGFAGAMVAIEPILEWMRTGEKPSLKNLKWTVMLVDDERVVHYMTSETCRWDSIGSVVWAIGSGSDYALGAMYAGKSATDAVRIASRLDIETGRGCDVVTF